MKVSYRDGERSKQGTEGVNQLKIETYDKNNFLQHTSDMYYR